MTSRAGSPAAGAAAAVVSWLVTSAVGPALVALPVNAAADKLCDAAVAWFKRLKQTDDLSRLVKAASGTSVHLSRAEVGNLRKLLTREQTWQTLAKGKLNENLPGLTDQIAGCLPRDGWSEEQARDAAGAIARGLIEFAVYDLEPETFQNVVQARLQQMTHQFSELDHQFSELDTALLCMHKDLYQLVLEAKALFAQVMDRLPPGPADLNEIRIYLKTLISWLNNDPWPRDPRLGGPVLTPSAIERKLRVRSRSSATASSATEETKETEEDAVELARKCRRLVILGEPGSGKTWLAKRITRACAEEALRELEEGADLDEIELPLYTTCPRLVAAPGYIRDAAVSNAIERIGDMGGTRIIGALHLYFSGRGSPTLLVIDSLDEASDTSEFNDRLREVDSLQSPWRVVLTSRPGSWSNQITIDENQDGRRGELLPLNYPADVEAVVRQWFAGEPERGQALAAQIAQRPGLRRGATVPLILAFYCILGGQQPLPEFRHELYKQVINRMLRAPWHPSSGSPPDPEACRAVLRTWAWQGAKNDQFSGVAAWEDDIPDMRAQLSAADQDAVDHVAAVHDPPGYDADAPARRFVHRAIREYLVAEHVAGLRPAKQAAQELLPHLWYDADWAYTAPMAIAMHPEHNELLRILLHYVSSTGEIPGDPSADDSGNEIRELVALVAAESRETDWSDETKTVIGQARVALARSEVFIKAAGWPTSNSQIRQIAITRMAGKVDSQETARWAHMLAELGEKHLAGEAVLGQLRIETHGWSVRNLADALARQVPVPGDKRQARDVLLARLGDSPSAPELVAALLLLEPSPDDKQRALATMLAQLADPAYPLTDWYGAPDLMFVAMPDVLMRLEPTAEDTRQAFDALLERLARERNGERAVRLMDMLVRLDPAPQARHQVLDAGLQLLLFADQRLEFSAGPLWEAVMGLVESDEEKHRALDTLIRYLSGQVTMTLAADLAPLVAQLDPTPEDKRRAREVLLGLLAARRAPVLSQTKSARNLAAAFLQLAPTPDDICQARRTLLGLLSQATLEGKRQRSGRFAWFSGCHGAVAADSAAALLQLDPPPEDKRQARYELLDILTNHDRSEETPGLADVAVMLGKLDPAPSDERQARGALLALLAYDTRGVHVKKLAGALAQLDPAPSDKDQARGILHDLLRGKAVHSADEIMTGLTLLGATPDDLRQTREAARDALLARIGAGDLATFGTVAKDVSVLLRLASTPDDKRQTLDGLLGLLARETKSDVARDLIGGIAQLDPTVHDLNSWRAWATPPPRELLAAARRNSAFHEWLTFLSV